MSEIRRRRSFIVIFWSALAAVLFLTFLSIFAMPNFATRNAIQGPGLVHLDRAERVINKSYSQPDALSTQAVTVMLPDRWDLSLPQHEGFARYSALWRAPDDGSIPNSIFVPKASMNIEVFLNGNRIGGLGEMTGELSRNWNRPYYFEFPEELVNTQGNNRVEILVAGYEDYRSGLGRFWIGPRTLLEPKYRMAYWLQVNASMLASAIALSATVVILAGAAYFKRAGGLVYLALAVLGWDIRNIGYYLDWTPLPHELWSQLVLCLYAWFGSLYGMFLLRYLNIRSVRPKWALLGYGAFVSLSLLIYDQPHLRTYTTVLLIPVLPVLIGLNLILLKSCWQEASRESAIIGFTSLLFILLQIRDLSISAGFMDYETVKLSQMTGILLFAGCSGVVLYRYKKAVEGLESALNNVHLQLSAREDELLEQFEVIRRIQTQRTKDEERRRIMQDIHDGVGSSLVSAINLTQIRPLRQEEMRQVLNDCLDDLRFAIDSLDPASNDLLAVLGNFRWRFEKRLKTAGIKLIWNVFESPQLHGYTSRQVFELLRIIQEAFGNILKHAQCTQIIMTVTQIKSDEVLIQIDDNGIGLPEEIGRNSGRGLTHMKRRAQALNAKLKVFAYSENDRTGTRVELLLPIKGQ